ncbi:flagellar export protein FliJ [Aquincola sp. MAHUQ-54]|uniref:Flagellar FliJ protein n=1 Tax=Aquincola agrisoli TaxID=3119538 RepID=A0AAW9QJR3_9BURK
MTTRALPLNRLVELREREVDRLTADFAAREAMRQRYVGNIERMQALCRESGASGSVSPALAANFAGYKESLIQLAESHRTDLAAHEAQMVVAQQALHQAARGHEVLRQVVEKQAHALQRAEGVREQKRVDDLASQVWLRGRS